MAYQPGIIMRRPAAVSLRHRRFSPMREYAYPLEPAFIRSIPSPWREEVMLGTIPIAPNDSMGLAGTSFFEKVGGFLEKYVIKPSRQVIRFLAPAAGVQVVPYPSYFANAPWATTQGPTAAVPAPMMGPPAVLPGAPTGIPGWLLPVGIGVGGIMLLTMMGGGAKPGRRRR